MKLKPTPTKIPLVKAFYLGLSGEGKSGSTVPLAIEGPIKGCKAPGPGLELCVLDFDGKYEEIARAVLANTLAQNKISKTQHDEALGRIDVCVCRENTGVIQVAARGGKQELKYGVKGAATAWQTATKQIDRWLSSLSASHVLIIDSLTHAAKVAVNYDQALNNRLNVELTWKEFMGPQQRIAALMTLSADVPCNTIICAHQTVMELYKKTGKTDPETNKPEEELVDVIMAPVSIGRAGSLELPSQFNHMLVAASEGSGSAITRYLHTKPIKGIACKSPFFNAERRYPIETGWVEYMGLRGGANK